MFETPKDIIIGLLIAAMVVLVVVCLLDDSVWMCHPQVKQCELVKPANVARLYSWGYR